MEKQENLFHYEGEPIKIEKITAKDIRPEVPETDGTVMVLQRNARDNRDYRSSEFGALEKEAREKVRAQSAEFFNELFNALPKKDRKKIDVMVIASDASLITPDGKTSEHKRAVETAEEVIAGLKESMKEFELSEDQFLNSIATTEGGAIEVSGLRDLLMLEESQEFVDFLTEKYGTGQDFWEAYEEDKEKKKRLELGVEGSKEIADRVNYELTVQARIAQEHHRANPGRKLVLWAISHYDSLSPFIKQHVLGKDVTTYLPVEQGGGITLSISKGGQISSTIQDQEINFK